jgi:hypothetical protein
MIPNLKLFLCYILLPYFCENPIVFFKIASILLGWGLVEQRSCLDWEPWDVSITLRLHAPTWQLSLCLMKSRQTLGRPLQKRPHP